MAQKSDVKNDPLPDAKDKFWPKDSENYEFRPVQKSCDRKHHKFKYTKQANSVKCDCGIGFYLSADTYLKDEHIYCDNELVI